MIPFSELDIETNYGGSNNNDGGVQIDYVTVTVNDTDHTFKAATTVSGDVYIIYMDYGENETDFTKHFNLKDDERVQDKRLHTFFEQNIGKQDCVGAPDVEGNETDIDGFHIEITDFSHQGGEEFGFMNVTINGEDYQFDMHQDCTSMNRIDTATFESDDDEERAKAAGIELCDELQSFLFSEYERLSNESR